MPRVCVLVLRAPGINCDEETVFAWQQAGADAESVHVNRLIESPRALERFQIITVPGGFSYGDDIASGRILGNQLVRHLGEAIRAFVERGGLVLGICNGFQVLVRAGLLPGADCGTPVSLVLNDSARYEDRWVRIRAEAADCPFLEAGEEFETPVAHAEGKFVVRDESSLSVLESRKRIALRYVVPGSDGATSFPDNPNGSTGNVAGLVDATGRILGLMPHPERHLFATQHPLWTRRANTDGDGRRLFRRAVSALS